MSSIQKEWICDTIVENIPEWMKDDIISTIKKDLTLKFIHFFQSYDYQKFEKSIYIKYMFENDSKLYFTLVCKEGDNYQQNKWIPYETVYL